MQRHRLQTTRNGGAGTGEYVEGGRREQEELCGGEARADNIANYFDKFTIRFVQCNGMVTFHPTRTSAVHSELLIMYIFNISKILVSVSS